MDQKLAFLCSGQGDQYPGMGQELVRAYPAAAAVYERCDAIRPATSRQCFFGTEEELKETRNTQPCLFAFELAAAEVLFGKGVIPAAVAGFSLGEVAAATISGLFEMETGFRLVCRRGELMQQAAEQYETRMAVVLRLSKEQVEACCARYSDLYPVNYNCPGQITVSGLAAQMEDFLREVRTMGGRAVPLKVGGAFHSPFMKEASEEFASSLARVKMTERSIPLYSNRTAERYPDKTDPGYLDRVIKLLSGQIASPVLWENLIRQMIADGIRTFVELGPGRTLTNMMKKIDTDVKAYSLTDYLTEVEGC